MNQNWPNKTSGARKQAVAGLKTTKDILGFAADNQSGGTVAERALFAASIVFVYGVWENFIEQLAIETSTYLCTRLNEHQVPNTVRDLVTTKNVKTDDGRWVSESRSTWELSVSPGWRSLWKSDVQTECEGEVGRSWGINSMTPEIYEKLAGYCCIEPWTSLDSKPSEKLLTNQLATNPGLLPTYLSDKQKRTLDIATKSPKDQVAHLKGLAKKPKAKQPALLAEGIRSLISVRGEVAHSGKIPDGLVKVHATRWIDLVGALTEDIDKSWRYQAKALIDSTVADSSVA